MKNISIVKLGKTIKSRRKYLGLTQKELASLAEVSLNFLCQLELGKESVQFDKLLKVISSLGLQFRLENGKEEIALSEDLG